MRAIAVVSSDENLENASAARRSEIVLDGSASHDQKVALLNVLKAKYAGTLGQIASVRSAPITFKHEGQSYEVASAAAALNVEACLTISAASSRIWFGTTLWSNWDSAKSVIP
jgi:hypothetical protein